MSFNLSEIVPWGRSFIEYARMFSLNDEDLANPILGCGDGPASFNAEATAQGYQVVSVDPLYHFSGESIGRRFEEIRPTVLAETQANRNQFLWTVFHDVGHLEEARTRATENFLHDYPTGTTAGRYVAGELPKLPFEDGQFGLALVSHLLFLYSEQLSLSFHLASLRELLRVAREVRVFPLQQLDATPSPYLFKVLNIFRIAYYVEIERVDYEFQRGADQMLRISHK